MSTEIDKTSYHYLILWSYFVFVSNLWDNHLNNSPTVWILSDFWITVKIRVKDYRRNSTYWIALGGKVRVDRGIRGSRWSACGPNENWKERLSSCREYLVSLVIFVLIWSTNSEINIQIVLIRSWQNSKITGPTVIINGNTVFESV